MCPVGPCNLIRPGRGFGLKMFPIRHFNRNNNRSLIRSWWCLPIFRTPAKTEYLIYPVMRQLYYVQWKSTCKSYDSSLIAFTEVQDWIWPMRVGSSVSIDLVPSLSGIWLEKLTAKPRSVIGLYICLARLIPGFTALILTGSSVSMNLSRWCDKATNSSSKQNELKWVFLKRNITHAVPNYHTKEWEGCLETQEVQLSNGIFAISGKLWLHDDSREVDWLRRSRRLVCFCG